jgi:hypothetical protein
MINYAHVWSYFILEGATSVFLQTFRQLLLFTTNVQAYLKLTLCTYLCAVNRQNKKYVMLVAITYIHSETE